MKAIEKRRNGYALLFATSICLAVWFGLNSLTEMVFIFAAASIILFRLLIRQNQLLYDARLIWDNCIFAVPFTVISTVNDKEKIDTQETIVSTFGILLSSKVYKWGSDGVRGVRLRTIKIDRVRINLTFGDGAKIMQVKLIHGMTNEQAVMEIKQKLWRETGVTAEISGW